MFCYVHQATEAIKLASECDAMVVIGGRDSANSRHLAELCADVAPIPSSLRGGALDMPAHSEMIGVTAGASAPGG